MNYFSKYFSLYITLPQRDQVPIIRFVPNTFHQTLVNFTVAWLGYWQTGCLWWEAVESWFHLDKKSFLHWKQFPGILTWSHYSKDKYDIWIVDEMDMTPLQVRYSWGKFLTQIQSGTPSTIIYTRWSSWQKRLGCHAPIGSSLAHLTTRFIMGAKIPVRRKIFAPTSDRMVLSWGKTTHPCLIIVIPIKHHWNMI